jgi:hypothetical protein
MFTTFAEVEVGADEVAVEVDGPEDEGPEPVVEGVEVEGGAVEAVPAGAALQSIPQSSSQQQGSSASCSTSWMISEPLHMNSASQLPSPHSTRLHPEAAGRVVVV